MTAVNNKIVSLKNWKDKKLEISEETSLLNYLKALSFHDLMNEAENTRNELNSGELNSQTTLKYKTILKEFSNRLKADGLSAGLSSITESAENKLSKLKNLF
ncbi:hypothetical protein BIY24_12455 [Halobacteriovorax marinus]|uniref:hypothetical protein n=1 Tax=Halobacteriovorax marinus TaxID=97084 RepID=UPI000BC3242A|nr:hypothetical protein [Halobacteriovorax marinus]ATH08728.1 hypothetical protein BIY24_12455 [Halobacteriovorax marinus]